MIAANADNGIGIAGIAPNARIMPLRVLNAQGQGTYSDVAAAMVQAVDQGAQIINLSLGGTNASSVLNDAVDYAVAHGVMVIAAAGNTGGSVLYPAAYAPVIAVGSVDPDLQMSSFSSRGPEIDLLAPGRDILTTGLSDYRTMSGTSFAAPQVAGVAALEIALGRSLVVNGGIVAVDGVQAQPVVAPTEQPAAGSGGTAEAPDIPLRIMVPHPDVAAQMQVSGQSLGQLFPQMDLERSFSPGPKMDVALGQAVSFKTLAILVQFSDVPTQTSASYFDTRLFGTSGATLHSYFDEVSYGQLDIVTLNLPSSLGWETAQHPYSYYVNGTYCTNPDTYPQNCQGLAEDAVALVDPVVDFSQYDNNGDGWVDTVFIIHAGPGAEVTQNLDDVWSHSWTTVSYPLVDGVQVGSYTVEPEYLYTPGDMTHGVFAHELAHVFGLPDLYDIDYSSNGVGSWSLMSNGAWNGSYPGSTPAHFDAWSRLYLGYTTATDITGTNQTINLPNVEENATGTIYRIKANAFDNEYYLLENRLTTGSDSQLPGSGLLIWHVDEGLPGSNIFECQDSQNWLCPLHFRVALEQADGHFDLEKANNYGDTGDPFRYTMKDHFDFSSNPLNSSYFSDANPCWDIINITGTTTMAAQLRQTCTYSPGLMAQNDEIADAEVITSVPYEFFMDASNITGNAADPAPCALDVTNTAWFKYTATADATYNFNAYGSNFDTVLAVYDEGMNPLGCNNDDINLQLYQSSLDINLTSGQTIYIMLGEYDGYTTVTQRALHMNVSIVGGMYLDPYNILAELYLSTDGPNWNNASNWGSSNYCNWYGVTCYNGDITGLDLRDNNLTGPIPPSLGNLLTLNILKLSNNNLSGEIPAHLGNITGLTNLRLSSNNLTGEIPTSFSYLTSMTSLILDNNDLEGSIPPELGNLTKLVYLQIYGNELEGDIPTELGNLTKLQFLYLHSNHLTGSIPTSFANLDTLNYLQLNDNRLSGSITPELGDLNTLEHLSLQNNQLSGEIPTAITNMTSLTSLNLGYNMLSASDPDVLSFLASKDFGLGHNPDGRTL